ncbi:malonyl-CoA decarboxylase-domain-containing protein [Phlyctochytrium arcticum]|nr:malonyl-CoA decarboxylase-domain-containing protein [Phlyctochytrium arcticum]
MAAVFGRSGVLKLPVRGSRIHSRTLPRHLPLCLYRTLKTFSKTLTKDDSKTGHSTSAAEGQVPDTRLASAIVTEYWDAVMKFSQDPGTYTLGSPDGTFFQDAPTTKPGSGYENTIKNLLWRTLSIRREQGDILPSLLARKCCEFYESLPEEGRITFLRILGRDFGVNREAIKTASQAYINLKGNSESSERSFIQAEQTLRTSLRPLHEKLFDQINRLPGGMQFLVHLRGNLLDYVRKNGNDPYLSGVESSLKQLLHGWFSVNFLDLERITWNSSASILEKIVRYEAVHAIPTWQSLKQRLGSGRLCYAFFHRGMPMEPLTFVQVALTNDIPQDVDSILSDHTPDDTNTSVAVFYSISSSQKGLSGVEMGNFLIKRVVKEIEQFYPHISTFCTLSPIPGFRRWLESHLNTDAAAQFLFDTPESQSDLRQLRKFATGSQSALTDWQLLLALTKKGRVWAEDTEMTAALKPILMRLCARYLLLEKKRSSALDPVANFHIRNGACLQRLNWHGDTSEKGISQSYGIMVNYNYVLSRIESNNQLYLLDGTVSVLEPVDETVQEAFQIARSTVGKCNVQTVAVATTASKL